MDILIYCIQQDLKLNCHYAKSSLIKTLYPIKNISAIRSSPFLWKQLKPCDLTAIWNNPDFLINKTTFRFNSWKTKGITQIHHLFANNNLLSIHELTQKYNMVQPNYFGYYLQNVHHGLHQYRYVSTMISQESKLLSSGSAHQPKTIYFNILLNIL